MALIIGNGNYAFSDPLPNAPKDAGRLAARLTRLGFEVEPSTVNLDRSALRARLSAFAAKLRAAGPNVIGFFYYAGHAAQSPSGVNYLMPIDARADAAGTVQAQGVPMQTLLQAMEDTNNAINIVVLDACRDWFKADHNPNDPKGLHDMGRHASMLIAYAVRPGDTADEGANLDSSPFSSRLIEALDEQPGDPIVLVLDDVKSRVYQDSDSSQLPLVVDGLIASGRWSFVDASLAGVADKPQPAGVGTPVSGYLAGLNRERLLIFFRGRKSLVDALLARRDVLEKYQINTPLRLSYFLAQIAFETGGFTIKEERFGYSVDVLRRRFPQYVTSDEMARQIVGQPERIANIIYARRSLGNGAPDSGDGWRYRGRGPLGLFITGRANYRRYGDMIGIDLINSPDLASDPAISVAISAAVWASLRPNLLADADDLKGVVYRLNGIGALSTLQPRAVWLAQAKQAVTPIQQLRAP